MTFRLGTVSQLESYRKFSDDGGIIELMICQMESSNIKMVNLEAVQARDPFDQGDAFLLVH